MKRTIDTTWGKFKKESERLDGFWFRGDTKVRLKSDYVKKMKGMSPKLWAYERRVIIPLMREVCGPMSWERIHKDSQLFTEFLGFLRHNEFPVPYIDWTTSPKIAAYFAFNRLKGRTGDAFIYAFDMLLWNLTFFSDEKSHEDLNLRRKEYFLFPSRPYHLFNPKAVRQKSAFTITNTPDAMSFIRKKEREEQKRFLWIYKFGRREREKALAELEREGINEERLLSKKDPKYITDILGKYVLKLRKEAHGSAI